MIYKSKILFACGVIVSLFPFSSANAQSIGSFATRPIVVNEAPPPPNTIEMPHNPPHQPIVAHSPPIIVVDDNHGQKVTTSNLPAPVVMFRQTNFPESSSDVISRLYPNHNPNYDPKSLPNISQFISSAPVNAAVIPTTTEVQSAAIQSNETQKRRRRFWEPLELPATPAPSILEPAKGLYRDITMDTNAPIDPMRGPMKAIVQDSSRALRRDVPQAIADTLPWVDSARKQEPFDNVLARVSDNLARANASDPEWAIPAQSEIRELATRLDRLSTPPQYVSEYQEPIIEQKPTDVRTARPFYARPIWPGARAASEGQIRPVAIVSNTSNETGAQTTGQNIMVTPDAVEAHRPEAPKRQTRRRR